MADRGALDAAITALSAEVSNVINLTQTVISKSQASSPTPIDFSPEISQLGAIGQNIQEAVAAIQAAATSPTVPQTSTSTTGAANIAPSSAVSSVTGTANNGAPTTQPAPGPQEPAGGAPQS